MTIEKTITRSLASQTVSRVISFTSGKGGVGKTSIVVNVGLALTRLGKSVLIIDGDLGLANVDVLFGIRPVYTLADFFSGKRTLQEVVVSGPEGLAIIPAASGNESICNLDSQQRMMLLQAVDEMPYGFDYILIDTPAGIGPDVMYLNGASGEIVCVITPEPTSLTDAYALIKILAREYGERSFSVISNNVTGALEGNRTFSRLQRAVERFLHVELKYLGFVPHDDVLCEAVRSQRALLEIFPSSAAGRSITALAERIEASFYERKVKGGMQFFFRQLLNLGPEQDCV